VRRESSRITFDRGTVIAGRYRVEAVLGLGGMASVYRAVDLELGREVALKVLDSRLCQLEEPEVARRRFLREARATAAIDSPHVVPIFDVGRDGEHLYLVEKLLRGDTIDAVMRSQQPSLSAVVRWARDALGGLSEIHRTDMVHRDVNPSNLFITHADRAVLIDLGIVLTDGERLTSRNLVLGTPEFMAPEQATGAAPTARSDLYALALVLLFVAAGRRDLVEGEAQVQRRIDGDAWIDPELRVVSEPLRPILRRALARDPARRFGSALEMRASLLALPALDGLVPFRPLLPRVAGG
jgi:serine/threonine-protein kinase